MTAGNPERRDYDASAAQQAITHVCLQGPGGDHVPEGPALPSKPCTNGVRSQVYFPSCWDGKNLDSANHQSHMAYPSSYNGGKCPDTHPNPMISIFFEFIFDTAKFEWYGDTQPFVYAMGDTTGYGLHGDFLNGWDVDVLQHGIDTKTTNDAGCAGDVTCQGIFEFPDHYGNTCSLPPLIDEPITGKMAALPGCNPVHNGPVPSDGTCTSNATLGISMGNQFVDMTAQGWAYVGCGTDDYYNRAMTKQLAATDTMTPETCIKAAQAAGFSMAGLEYGRECWGANSIPDKAMPPPNTVGSCNKPCSGDAAHMCGDASRLSIYKKCDGTCQNAQFTLPGGSIGGGGSTTTPATGGGATTGTTGGAAPADSPAAGANPPSKQQTPTDTTNGTTGGTTGDTTSGSNTGTDSTVNVPAGSPPMGPDPAHSPMPSPPGGTDPTTAPANTTTTDTSGPADLPAGWKAAGCYVDPVRPRALQGEDLAWWGVKITASNCAKHCDEKGFSMAGTENGGQCFCGNKLEGGSAPATNAADCNMPCEGGATETCGGPGRLSLSVKGVSKRRRSAVPQ